MAKENEGVAGLTSFNSGLPKGHPELQGWDAANGSFKLVFSSGVTDGGGVFGIWFVFL